MVAPRRNRCPAECWSLEGRAAHPRMANLSLPRPPQRLTVNGGSSGPRHRQDIPQKIWRLWVGPMIRCARLPPRKSSSVLRVTAWSTRSSRSAARSSASQSRDLSVNKFRKQDHWERRALPSSWKHGHKFGNGREFLSKRKPSISRVWSLLAIPTGQSTCSQRSIGICRIRNKWTVVASRLSTPRS